MPYLLRLSWVPVPDPDKIVTGFQAEFDALLKTARRKPPAASVQEMAVKLDKALSALESVAEKRISASPGDTDMAEAPGVPPVRCRALTAAGKPCKNRPVVGSSYCHVHQEQAVSAI